MNPMFAAALGSIFRWGLAFLAGYLVSKGIWTEAEAGLYVGAAAMALTGLSWGLYQKYTARVKLVTALATPHVISEKGIEATITDTSLRPPVSMKKETTPYPVGETNPRWDFADERLK